TTQDAPFMADPAPPSNLRRWHDESPVPAGPPRPPSRRRQLFVVLAAMLALGAVFVGLLFWLRPRPSPYLVPLWVAEYQSPLLPPPPAARVGPPGAAGRPAPRRAER